jgi:hypothetical protein
VKRSLVLMPLLLVAACSGGEAQKEEEQPAAAIEPGLWEASAETTAFRSTDNTTPAIKATVGDKATVQACVTEADKAKPAATLFAGEGYDCEYKSSYMQGARLNHSLECRREGVAGSIPMTVEGTFKADSIDATVTTQTYLPGSGDFAMTRKLTARKTAATCPSAAEGGKDKAKG